MHFQWEVTSTHGNQPNILQIEQRVNNHFVFSICGGGIGSTKTELMIVFYLRIGR